VDPGTKAPAVLTPEQRKRLRELFDAALDLDGSQRAAFLEEACAGDDVVRGELEQLLAAHGSSNSWLDRPLLEGRAGDKAAPTTSWEGRQIGSYHILHQLGSGGMGSVFLAERTIGKVRRQVALKIIRPAFMTSAEMVRRFEQEREILASLDHPNIARLLDIGSTPEGIPFLVMDYVQGEPIDGWCDSRKIRIPDRLKLFCSACAAIQYAHSRGVIHRDLKPANMLITADGTLKLLDFGIAKVLRTEGDTLTLATRTGAGLMTIEYASPEQIRGDEIGPQSDVYSLGVVLYELLTGRRPYRIEGQMVHALAQAICDEQPVTPSTAAAEISPEVSEARAEQPQALRRRLSGDLDSIVMKALRKRPQWRYESPAALAEDVRRHLAGERVSARRDTIRYRFERLVHHVLHPGDAVFHTHGMIMWTAGLMGFLLLIERHLILTGQKARPDTPLDVAILIVWILWSMWERRRMERAGKFSVMDRLSWTMFTVIAIVFGAVTVAAAVRRFLPAEVMAVFWNAGLSVGLLVVGIQASRLMTAGGAALLLSAIMAIFQPKSLYLWLAVGMVAGMIVPGLIFTLQNAPLDRLMHFLRKPSRSFLRE
jgi:serine/threonine protein kinase